MLKSWTLLFAKIFDGIKRNIEKLITVDGDYHEICFNFRDMATQTVSIVKESKMDLLPLQCIQDGLKVFHVADCIPADRIEDTTGRQPPAYPAPRISSRYAAAFFIFSLHPGALDSHQLRRYGHYE
jgi:hypothetical protein